MVTEGGGVSGVKYTVMEEGWTWSGEHMMKYTEVALHA